MTQVVQQLRRMSVRIRRSRFGKRESWSSCTSDETAAANANTEHVRTKSTKTSQHHNTEQEIES